MFNTDTSNCKFCKFMSENADLPLRAALAATFIIHGYDKIFVNGVDKFAGMLGKMGVPMPGAQAWLAALAEFGGGILLILGLGTRIAAAGHMVLMAVAIAMVHSGQGFKMKAGENGMAAGYEWQLALFLMALSLVMRGAGPLSLDKTLLRNCCKKNEPPQAAG